MGLIDDRKAAREKAVMEANYAKQLEGRAANVARNAAEGRTMQMTGTPLNGVPSQVAEDLGDFRDKMLAKGNVVHNIANEVKTAEGAEPRLLSLASRFPKLKTMLALAGPAALAAGAFGIGNKAMAGDFKGAAGDTADMATDYIPGVGEAKMALSSPELGKGSDETVGKGQFDFSPYKTPTIGDQNPSADYAKQQALSQMSDSSINKPNPTRYADLMNQIGGKDSPDSLKDALDNNVDADKRSGKVKMQQNY